MCKRIQPAKLVLIARGITQRQAAQDIGVTSQYFGRVVNGYAKPSQHFRDELARYLGLSPHELFSGAPCRCRVDPSPAQIEALLRASAAA